MQTLNMNGRRGHAFEEFWLDPAIAEQQLAPLLTCVRRSKMRIIHAPSPDTAKRQEGWVNLAETNPLRATDPDWPPKPFLRKEDGYAQFARPFEPRDSELDELRTDRAMHPLGFPAPGEPVVANGEELHQYCKQNGILFLLYAGFNTNCCVLLRDYGTLAMRDRGYEVLMIRDCTTGMESYDSQADLRQTEGTILFLEMFRTYSITSDEVIGAMERPS